MQRGSTVHWHKQTYQEIFVEMLGCLQAAGAPYSCGPACPAGQESQIRSTKLVVLSAETNSPGLITPLFIPTHAAFYCL